MARFAIFPLKSWHSGVPKLFSPQGLLERVQKDSKSNYNWVASAPELVRTCSFPGFPEEIALEIEKLILQCFTNLASNLYESLFSTHEEENAVWTCYSRIGDNELCEHYLHEIIERMIKISYGDIGAIFNRGPEHDQFEQQFIDEEISELHNDEDRANKPINYIAWRKSLSKKYEHAYDKAVKLGKFNSDYEERDKLFSTISDR